MTNKKESQEFIRRNKLLEEYQNSEDYRSKLEDRLKINDACIRSTEARINAYAACKKDPVFFFNNFLWTPNDKYEQYHFPFILFDFQEEYVDWIVNKIKAGEDGLTEKSREMGVTWLNVGTFLWFWFFSDNYNALLGSYKEKLVDDRTKDSLFGMIDYYMRSLPKWMLPKRFNPDKHRTKMKLINPENHNVIVGDTMNPEFGRASRRSMIFMDEGAFWDYFQDAWQATGDTTNCRLTVSTPNGYNSFAVLRDSGIDVKTLRWQLHPLKDQGWYDYESSRRSEEAVARELEISYQKSQKGRVYPEWSDVEIGEFPYDPSLPLYVSWDFGRSDDTAIIWWQKDRDKDRIIIVDVYWNNGKLIDFYVPFITGIVPSDSYSYSQKDLDIIDSHRYWKTGTHFGDPAGRFSNQVTDKTVVSILRDNGIHINFKDEWKEFRRRIEASKVIIKNNLKVNKNPRTKYLNVCMINSQYKEVKVNGTTMINSRDNKPRHDQYSHIRSSFEYGALGLTDSMRRSGRIRDKFAKKIQPNHGRRKAVGY